MVTAKKYVKADRRPRQRDVTNPLGIPVASTFVIVRGATMNRVREVRRRSR
jgi:hypothetical protein